MTDDRVLDYLRSRGQAEMPPNLVTSVMTALDDPVRSTSRFAAWVPAVAIAAGAAVIAAIALLIGQDPSIGPDPSPATSSPTPSTSAEPTIDDLGVALLDAVDVLRDAPGVEGRQQVEIDGTIGSVTWFDWRPNGDQVVVQRQDLDVTETGWWIVPDGAPPVTGERIYTNIRAKVGEEFFFTNEAGDWEVAARDDSFPTGGFGPAILDGAILPWRPLDGLVPSLTDPSDAHVQRDDLSDGVVEWHLEFQWMGAPLIQRWTIGPGGELRSWTFEREDRTVDPEGDFNDNATHGWLQYTITGGEPIERPDVDADPDPGDFGYPTDMPLEPAADASAIDYRAYVEDVLDALETLHVDSENIDWPAARSAALDGLPDEPPADQAYQRIANAIRTFDVFNTAFIRPQDLPPGGPGALGPGPTGLPSAERIGSIGHVVLPTPGRSGSDALGDYLRAARLAMARVEESDPACGWIVDLRDYGSWAWGPSILSLGGLLGEGRTVTFVSGARDWWLEVDAAGVVTSAGFDESDDVIDSPYIIGPYEVEPDDGISEVVASEPPYVPSVTGAPVAILVSNATASGGEQTLVAFLGRQGTRVFGAPTAGMPIVAPNVHLVDGAVVRVPTWIPVDRDGTRHTGNITPDEVIGDTRTLGSDAILDAAADWLDAQPGCA